MLILHCLSALCMTLVYAYYAWSYWLFLIVQMYSSCSVHAEWQYQHKQGWNWKKKSHRHRLQAFQWVRFCLSASILLLIDESWNINELFNEFLCIIRHRMDGNISLLDVYILCIYVCKPLAKKADTYKRIHILKNKFWSVHKIKWRRCIFEYV